MNPLLKFGIGLGLLAALFLGERAWEHHIYQKGWSARDAKAALDEAKIQGDAEKKRTADAALALDRERNLRASFDAQMADRQQKETQYEKRIAALQSAARANALRLSIAVNSRSLPGCAASTDSAAAGGTGAEARVELMPETTAAVLGIAGDIAASVRDYNRLIDLYNAARETCNTVKAPS